jgi:hypothetical protein
VKTDEEIHREKPLDGLITSSGLDSINKQISAAMKKI